MTWIINYILSEDFAKNAIANGLFWIIDIITIVITLPILLSILEKRKWHSTRILIRNMIGDHAALVASSCSDFLIYVTGERPNHHKDESGQDELEKFKSEIRTATSAMYGTMGALSGAITPDMAIQISRLIEYFRLITSETRSIYLEFKSLKNRSKLHGVQSSLGTLINHAASVSDTKTGILVSISRMYLDRISSSEKESFNKTIHNIESAFIDSEFGLGLEDTISDIINHARKSIEN